MLAPHWERRAGARAFRGCDNDPASPMHGECRVAGAGRAATAGALTAGATRRSVGELTRRLPPTAGRLGRHEHYRCWRKRDICKQPPLAHEKVQRDGLHVWQCSLRSSDPISAAQHPPCLPCRSPIGRAIDQDRNGRRSDTLIGRRVQRADTTSSRLASDIQCSCQWGRCTPSPRMRVTVGA